MNASALAAPLSTDVTLVSHKVEFSEDSSFASSDTIGADAFSRCAYSPFSPLLQSAPSRASLQSPVCCHLPPLPHLSRVAQLVANTSDNTFNVIPETGAVQMDCKGLTLGRFYYVRLHCTL